MIRIRTRTIELLPASVRVLPVAVWGGGASSKGDGGEGRAPG
jgi:hypothetical protein